MLSKRIRTSGFRTRSTESRKSGHRPAVSRGAHRNSQINFVEVGTGDLHLAGNRPAVDRRSSSAHPA